MSAERRIVADLPELEIWTDGSCDNMSNVGGYAAVLRFGAHQKSIGGPLENTTSQRCEMTAAIEALKALKRRSSVTIHTDSRYLMDGATKWAPSWLARGKLHLKANCDLWSELLCLMEEHQVRFEKVKAHSGVDLNEVVDRMANEARLGRGIQAETGSAVRYIGLRGCDDGKFAVVDAEDFDKVSEYSWTYSFQRAAGEQEYAVCSINGKVVPMQNVILPPSDGLVVDHKNNNGLDNRKTNLRLATPRQNSFNRRPLGGKRYKGVRSNAAKTKFWAYIVPNGRKVEVGPFDAEEEAALAYNELARQHYGEFAYLNEIGSEGLGQVIPLDEARQARRSEPQPSRGALWPKESEELYAKFGREVTRLYPYVQHGKEEVPKVMTPLGVGTIKQAFSDGVKVALDNPVRWLYSKSGKTSPAMEEFGIQEVWPYHEGAERKIGDESSHGRSVPDSCGDREDTQEDGGPGYGAAALSQKRRREEGDGNTAEAAEIAGERKTPESEQQLTLL